MTLGWLWDSRGDTNQGGTLIKEGYWLREDINQGGKLFKGGHYWLEKGFDWGLYSRGYITLESGIDVGPTANKVFLVRFFLNIVISLSMIFFPT